MITAGRRAGLGLILGVLVSAAGCGGALRGPAHPGAIADSLRHAARPTQRAGEARPETRLNGHVVLGAFPVPVSPRPGSASVSWAREVGASPAGAERLIALGSRGAASPRDSLAAWREAARDPILGVYALRPIARLALALGDTAGADSAWARLAGLRSLWGWEALRSRCDLALARRDTARADALLASADRAEWPDAERAEWMGRRVASRLALRDTMAALDLAHQGLRRYPALPEAQGMLAALEAVLAARGESLSVADQRAAADVELLAGDRAEAARRLADLLGRPAVAGRWRVALRLGEVLRRARRFPAAHQALRQAVALAGNAADSARGWIERARTYGDAGRADSARRVYERVGRTAPEPALRAMAWWEAGRLAETDGAWSRAARDYERAAGESAQRSDAGLRAGLMALALGKPDRALPWFAATGGEAGRFWWAVAVRHMGAARVSASGTDSMPPQVARAARDSLRTRADVMLRDLARSPGYSFYRSAARETLGVRAWPGVWRFERAGDDASGLRLASALAALGLGDDAALILERWPGDPRLADAGLISISGTPDRLLVAARIAFAAGRPRPALRLVDRALAALADSADEARWSVSPWLYPPAYDSLFSAYPEHPATGTLDRTLLRALVWKESRFDASARSRSDAIGLTQLKRAAVSDVARWRREPAPSDSALLDPKLNLSYGAQYLERLIERFPGNLPAALAAYNAGSGTVSAWARLQAMGGDALVCEAIPFPETQDYVKTILAVRQAYRELQPVTVGR